MTKSKTVVTLPLSETQQKIDLLQKEISDIQQELAQAQDALDLVQNPPRFAPATGELPFFDRMSGILQEAKSEQERLEKVNAMREAIAQIKQSLAGKQQELVAATQELENLKQEAIWLERYEPLVSAFQAGYVMPQHQQSKIQQLQGYLLDAEKLLDEMQEIFDSGDPEKIKTWEGGHRGYAPLKLTIPKHKEIVAKQQEELVQAKVIDQKHFRDYIKLRVDIDTSLQKLLIAQSAYVEARQQFFEIAGDGATLGIRVQELKDQKIPLLTCEEGIIKVTSGEAIACSF